MCVTILKDQTDEEPDSDSNLMDKAVTMRAIIFKSPSESQGIRESSIDQRLIVSHSHS